MNFDAAAEVRPPASTAPASAARDRRGPGEEPRWREGGALDPLWVLGLRVGTSITVLGAGFQAVSDDDFARVGIAESFAHAPRLDPSMTSWLPFPFWWTGAAMLATERSLSVARGAALVAGLLAAWLCHRAGLWLGLSRRGALLGALLAALLPHSALLAVATVPEALCAACTLLAVGAIASPRADRRVLAGGLLLTATLSRYEAWPVGAVFAACQCVDAAREARASRRQLALGAAALLAMLGPIAWLLHGRAVHGDALFFVRRVVAYRQALHGASSSLLARALGTPRALLGDEPELTALLAGALVLRLDLPRLLRERRRELAALGALVGLLLLGELGDGAPTHHPGRALLVIWLFLALLLGEAVTRAWHGTSRSPHLRLVGVLGLALLTGASSRLLVPRDPFAERRDEVEIGTLARALVPSGERLAVDTDDYGHFAVVAAFGRPESAVIVRDHDPRRAQQEPTCAALHATGARWLVAPHAAPGTPRTTPPAATAPTAAGAGLAFACGAPVAAQGTHFALFELTSTTRGREALPPRLPTPPAPRREGI